MSDYRRTSQRPDKTPSRLRRPREDRSRSNCLVQARTTALRLLMCPRPADCSVCASSEDAIHDGGAVFDDRTQLLATDGFGHSRPAGVPRSVGLFARWARRSPLAASTSGQALPPGCSSRPSGRCVTRRHRGLLAFARPVFSSPGCSPDGTGPLGLLPRASHPQQARTRPAHVEVGTDLEH